MNFESIFLYALHLVTIAALGIPDWETPEDLRVRLDSVPLLKDLKCIQSRSCRNVMSNCDEEIRSRIQSRSAEAGISQSRLRELEELTSDLSEAVSSLCSSRVRVRRRGHARHILNKVHRRRDNDNSKRKHSNKATPSTEHTDDDDDRPTRKDSGNDIPSTEQTHDNIPIRKLSGNNTPRKDGGRNPTMDNGQNGQQSNVDTALDIANAAIGAGEIATDLGINLGRGGNDNHKPETVSGNSVEQEPISNFKGKRDRAHKLNRHVVRASSSGILSMPSFLSVALILLHVLR